MKRAIIYCVCLWVCLLIAASTFIFRSYFMVLVSAVAFLSTFVFSSIGGIVSFVGFLKSDGREKLPFLIPLFLCIAPMAAIFYIITHIIIVP